MRQRSAFTMLEVMVATMIFSFVALSMMSVYYAANRNVLQNLRSDKLKSDLSTAMRAIGNVMSDGTKIVKPGVGESSNNLVVLSNVSAESSPCCPMVPPATYGAPAPRWHRFCIDGSRNLWYYNGAVSGCGGCPNGINGNSNSIAYDGYDIESTCGASGNGRTLLATKVMNTNSSGGTINAFSRVKHTNGVASRLTNINYTRLVRNDQTINVYLHTIWNSNNANAAQTPVDYTLESYFTVLEPK